MSDCIVVCGGECQTRTPGLLHTAQCSEKKYTNMRAYQHASKCECWCWICLKIMFEEPAEEALSGKYDQYDSTYIHTCYSLMQHHYIYQKTGPHLPYSSSLKSLQVSYMVYGITFSPLKGNPRGYFIMFYQPWRNPISRCIVNGIQFNSLF